MMEQVYNDAKIRLLGSAFQGWWRQLKLLSY